MSEQIGETTTLTRFGEKQLQIQSDAPILHFHPLLPRIEGQPRTDRFGNRIFTSQDKIYNDRENRPNKAALLVSREGETFLHNNSGILLDIDRGLQALTEEEESGSENSNLTEIDLRKDRKLEQLTTAQTAGAQSLVFLLQTGGEKYVVKVKKRTTEDSAAQPYSNEMLQAQALALDLGDDLAKSDMKMPEFLFASGQVSCTKFVEGERPTRDELARRVHDIEPKMSSYRDQQIQQGNTLWNGTKLDFYQPDDYRDEVMVLRTDNVIKQPDGKCVLVDFIYMDPEYANKFLTPEEVVERRRKLLEWKPV